MKSTPSFSIDVDAVSKFGKFKLVQISEVTPGDLVVIQPLDEENLRIAFAVIISNMKTKDEYDDYKIAFISSGGDFFMDEWSHRAQALILQEGRK